MRIVAVIVAFFVAMSLAPQVEARGRSGTTYRTKSVRVRPYFKKSTGQFVNGHMRSAPRRSP